MTFFDEDAVTSEAKRYELSTLVDSDFFMESIKEQIQAGLDGNTMDYLKEFHIKLNYINENYDESDHEQVQEYANALYRNIIKWIEDKYDIDIQFDEDSLLTLVNHLYQFFAIDMKVIVASFLFYYIRENYDALLQSMDEDRLNRSILSEFTDPTMEKPALVVGNLGTILDMIVYMDISFESFMEYAGRGSDIRSVVELSTAAGDILSISSEEGMVTSIMRQVRDSTYDHSMIVDVGQKLIQSFNLTRGE